MQQTIERIVHRGRDHQFVDKRAQRMLQHGAELFDIWYLNVRIHHSVSALSQHEPIIFFNRSMEARGVHF